MISMVVKTIASTQDADVTGKVVNTNQEPIVGASVYLMTSSSHILIKTAVTDTQGKYSILKAPKGNYYIQVSSVGYANIQSDPFDLDDQLVQVPDLILSAKSQEIEAVTVTGQVPLVQNVNGKLILNVENSTVAAGNNALEIVKRAPGVSVDKDENLQLMGQSGVNVTIDGRQTFMTGEQLSNFLKTTDGSQIKSIEVSTSRSAKDDAEGAVGTINIVMKKVKLEGFNGSFIASGGSGKHLQGNSSLNLNYKKNNSTVFGSYSYANNKKQFDLLLDRTISNGNQTTVFDQDAYLIEHEKNHNYRFGIEQKTSAKNTMLLQFTGNNSIEDGNNRSQSNIGPRIGEADTILLSNTLSQVRFNRYSTNFNNELLLDTVGSKLILDLDWSKFKTNNEANYRYRTENLTGGLFYPEERERNIMPVGIAIYVAKLDWQQQLKKGKLETGLKYSNVKSDNNLQFDSLNSSGNWVDFSSRSNHFIYTEQIAAAYADYSNTYGKWSLKAGVRAEYTFSDGNSISKNNQVKRNYLDWFPSANITYLASENHVFNLAYSRKISRPNYRYLNPFRYYIDKFTFQEGNPYLKPEYTNGITLNYTLMQMFNITLGTDLTTDAMVESMGQDSITNEGWIVRDNLGKSMTSYLNLNIPYQIGKVWTMNNNVTGIYMHFKGPIAGYQADLGSFFVQGTSNHNFKLSKQLSSELIFKGNTPFLYNVYKIHASWGIDLGVNYNFKDNRSSLKLAATDIFRTNLNRVSTDFHVFNTNINQYNDNRTIRLTYSFKFGNLKQQFRKKESGNEESERAN